MAEKLKIYACSGIGDVEQNYTYWTDNTQTVDNTQAVNTLLAKINSLVIEIKYLQGMTNADVIEDLDKIDMLCVALDAAQRYREDAKKLYHAGEVIATMMGDGAFYFNSLDDAERDVHLDSLLDRFRDLMQEDELKADDPEFMEWWKKTVCERNKVGLNTDARQATKKALVQAANGIGEVDESWKEDADISEYLLNAGTYFQYLYFTQEQLAKLPKIIAERQKAQKRIYNYCKAYFVSIYGSEEEMQGIIRDGIIKDFGMQPEEMCAQIAAGKKVQPIGFAFLGMVGAAAVKAFLSFLSVMATILVGIVTAICNAVVNSNTAKYAAMEKSIVETGSPKASDYDSYSLSGSTTLIGNKSSLLTFGLIGLGAILLLKK